MQSMRWARWTLAAGLLAGCAPKPKPVMPPPEPAPAAPEQVAQIRQELRHTDPNAEVGVVDGVLASNRLAAVRDVPMQAFPPGQTLNIVDAELKVIAHAEVDSIKGPFVVVKYQVVAREPRKGDLAVRLSERRPPAGAQPEINSAPADSTPAPRSQPPADTSSPTNPTITPSAPAGQAPPSDRDRTAPPAGSNTENVPSPAAGTPPTGTAPATQPSAPETSTPKPGELNK